MMMMFHGCVTLNNGRREGKPSLKTKIFQSELITLSMLHTNYIFVANLPPATNDFVVVFSNLTSMQQNINSNTRRSLSLFLS